MGRLLVVVDVNKLFMVMAAGHLVVDMDKDTVMVSGFSGNGTPWASGFSAGGIRMQAAGLAREWVVPSQVASLVACGLAWCKGTGSKNPRSQFQKIFF